MSGVETDGISAAEPRLFWGRHTGIGLAVALLTAGIDQATKLWLLYVYDIADRIPVRVTPFLDLVLVWNKGISYGLFQQQGALGQGMLLAIKAVAVILLWIWLSRTPSRLTAVALGLITGGAVGNAIDSLVHEGVADFVLFHITTQTIHFNWYVFNYADTAIVVGVAALLYESLFPGRAAKAPRSGP
ncbi:MAG TPA: signal peptidase II [Xanthobacteraceae bacterium]|jgi:signal peptidase II|nr:signal peptidase II [Xanthobacteraceae bacterium]